MPSPSLPLVTIVTPSFNQARFLRSAIESVLVQDHPRIEYVVVDGGSTDGSVDILASFGNRVTWCSEPDNGQAHAINKGLRDSRGEIVGWLNGDDVLAPGAVSAVVKAFEAHPEIGLVYGNGSILDEEGRVVRRFHEIEPFSAWRLLYGLDYILQPAAFFRRDALMRAGWLDERLNFALDWDLWIRLAACSEVAYLDEELAGSRVHASTKTSTGGWPRVRELGRLTRRHTGRFWTPGVQLYALDTLGQRLTSAGPTWLRRMATLIQGRMASRVVQRMGLHADGWLSPRGRVAVPRRWQGAEILLEAHRLPPAGPLSVAVEADGRVLARVRVERAGPFAVRVVLPEGQPPFVELRVSTNFSFIARPDPRRLAVRCVGLRPTRVEAAQS